MYARVQSEGCGDGVSIESAGMGQCKDSVRRNARRATASKRFSILPSGESAELKGLNIYILCVFVQLKVAVSPKHSPTVTESELRRVSNYLNAFMFSRLLFHGLPFFFPLTASKTILAL